MLGIKPSTRPRDESLSSYAITPDELDERDVFNPPPVHRPSPSGQGVEITKSGRGPLLLIGLLVGGAVSLFVVSSRANFLLGQLASVIWLGPALFGVWRGGFRKIMMIGVTTGLAYGAYSCSETVDPVLQRVVGSFGEMGNLIAKAAVVTGLVLIAGLFVKSIRNRWITPSPRLNTLDHLLGSGVGLCEGTLALLAICWATTMTVPAATMIRDQTSDQPASVRHRFAIMLLDLADEAQSETLGSFVERTNPIKNVPALREKLEEMNATGKLPLENSGSRGRSSGGREETPSASSLLAPLDAVKTQIQQYQSSAQERADVVERIRKSPR